MAQDLLTKPLTKADFHAFMSREPEGRFEFDGRRIIDMTGGTRNHSAIGTRFVLAIGRQLDPDVWQIHGPDRGVETPMTVRYPDAVVDHNTDAPKSRWTTAPVLIVEVLSPSSEQRDLVDKVAEYAGFASLEVYIVADPDQPQCEAWIRNRQRQFPATPIAVSGRDSTIAVPALGLVIALSDIYREAARSAPSV